MSSTRCRVILVLIVLLAAPRAAGAQVRDPGALDRVVLDELSAASVPGAAIAIVLDGQVVYAKGFGTASIETQEPMSPDRLFRLGSTTKMFTAAAVAALAADGRLDLHAPIGRYIPGLHASLARVTAHQLLSHTSGILDEAPMYGSHDEAALTKHVLSWSHERFFTEPGRIYSYSNPGYWLAGALIEAVTGRLYADYMHERLFAPLGMARTTLRPTVAMTYPLAQGHDVTGGTPAIVRPHANNAASWPAGSIFSNVLDLARFVTAFLDGGRLDGRQALPPAAVEKLGTPAARIPGSSASYGYGLNIDTVRGVRVLQHGGSRSGYGSTIRMAPDRRFGVIVLANRTGAGLPRVAERVMEMVLGLPAGTRDTTTAAPPPAAAALAAYVGVYSQGARQMEVVSRDGKLFLKQGARETELRPAGEHRFTSNLVFVAGDDGRIEYLHTGGRSWKKIP